jgi:ABC-type transport system involved in multi-copper enzyme maturation permease subunit
MFRLIIAKELREIIASAKFAITFLVCSLLIILAFYVGARSYQISRSQYEMAQSDNIRQMATATNWRNIDHHITLPPQPLANLVVGISNDIGRNINMPETGSFDAQDSRFNDDPIYAVFHFLDLDFLFQIILSLFAILFVYNAINGEKEQGTLRLTFSNAIPRNTYILGKVTGSFLALIVPLLIPVLIGCLLLVLMGIPMSVDEWTRLGLIILIGFLYLGAFATMSLFVSSITHRSSSSFLIMLVAWIVAVLIIPRTAVLLSGQAVDVISVDQVGYQRIMYENQDWDAQREKFAKYKVTGKDPNEAIPKLISFYEKINNDMEKRVMDFQKRLDEQRRNEEAHQQAVAFGLARISPASAFSLAATTLAGTSLELKRHYMDEALRYQEVYARFINSKAGERKAVVMQMPKQKLINPQELPPFQYQSHSKMEMLQAAVPDIGVLAFFNIIFFVGAFVAFLRYDVR